MHHNTLPTYQPANLHISPLVSEETEPASVERESAEVLSSEEGRDGLLAPGQHLHRHRLLPHAGHGQGVAVDVQEGPDREVNGESSKVATDVMIVDKQSEVPAWTETEGQAGPVLSQALLVSRGNKTSLRY